MQSTSTAPQSLESMLEWLYGTQLFGIKLGLSGMVGLLEKLGSPQNDLRFLHVAGTNGKGSTCAFLEAALRAAGHCTGLFTSPHLIAYNERIRVNGLTIPSADLLEILILLKGVCESNQPHPTFFEITTAAALLYFSRKKCSIVILETGMGGRLDATNVVTPLVSIIAPISLDHQQWLGETIAEIALEKAGIIKPGVPVVSAPQPSAAEMVLRETAAARGCALTFVQQPWPPQSPLGLAGPHQRWNAALADAALQAGGLAMPAATLGSGFASAQWPARFQHHGRWVLDGAHNEDGARVLATSWRQMYPQDQATLLFSAVAQKDLQGILSHMLPLAKQVVVAPLKTARAVPADDLKAEIQKLAPNMTIHVAKDVAAGQVAAEQFPGPLLCAGSLYLCGEMLSLLTPGTEFETSLQ